MANTNALQAVFGLTFLTALDSPILTIGKRTWTRADLADIGVTQLVAARHVSDVAKDYGAKDVEDLARKVGPRNLAGERGKGLATLFVLWKVFQASGIDPADWYAAGLDGAVRTFTSVKKTEATATARTKRDSKRKIDLLKPGQTYRKAKQ